MSATPPLRRIALAAGDPNGIGPEIALKALAALAPAQRDRITVFGPGAVLQRAASICGLSTLWPQLRHVEAGTLSDSAAVPGRIDAAAGASTVASATAALQAVRADDFDVVIACPHHETAIAQAGIPFSGYPSLVARVCGQPESSVFLLLVGGGPQEAALKAQVQMLERAKQLSGEPAAAPLPPQASAPASGADPSARLASNTVSSPPATLSPVIVTGSSAPRMTR